jgi:hypothetical protein
VVIDADVREVIAKTAVLPSTISRDAMAYPLDASELLGIQMEHLARRHELVAARRLFGFELTHAGETAAPQDAPYGGARSGDGLADHERC